MNLKNRLKKIESLTGQDKITRPILILFSGKDNIDEELKKYKRQYGDTPISTIIIEAYEDMKNRQNQTNLNNSEGKNGRNETQ